MRERRRTIGLTLALAAAATAAAAQDKLGDAGRKAWDQHRKGQAADAVKTMEKAAAQAPGGAGQLALSRFRARQGGEEGLTAALAAAQRAVQESAGGAPAFKAEALAHLAAMELRLASSKDALAHAEQAVQASATPEALEVLARALVRRGRAEEALAVAEKAGAAASSASGFALLGLDRPAEAATAFRQALEAQPARHDARIGLAAALLGSRKAAEAEAEARRAVAEQTGDPGNEEGFAVLGLAILATNRDDPATWARAISDAQTGATVLNPKNPAVKFAVGKIFENNGELAQAATNYQQALAVDRGFTRARQALIQVLIWQKKAPDAVAVARAAVAEDPNSAEAQLLLGQVLLSTQAYAEAIAPLEAAAKLVPTQARVQAALGTACRLQGDLEKASAAYKRALDLSPEDADLRAAYSSLLVGMGAALRRQNPPKLDEAVAAYRQALALDPKNTTAALGIGLGYYAAKRYDEAIQSFQEVVKLGGDAAADAEVYTAWCYVAKRDAAKAGAHLAKAARPEPDLEAAIKRVESRQADTRPVEGPREGPREGPDMGELIRRLQARDPAVRLGAVGALCRLGRDAVDALVFAVANDSDWAVRERAVVCLGNVGPGAAAAVPYLRQVLRLPPGPTVQTDQQLKDDLSLSDLKRRAREALAKIER
jgi:tetratricopeptide (TPR) repeat protein